MAKVYATLLTQLSYLPGTLVLNASLRRVEAAYPLIVFATPDLPAEARLILSSHDIATVEIDWLEPKNAGELSEHDARFRDTWCKLAVFGLAQYERIVLLDSDMLVVRNLDELLEMDLPPDHIAAAHACTCNPRKLAHYPKDWIPANCAHTYANGTQPIQVTATSPPTFHSLNSGLVVLHPSTKNFAEMRSVLDTDPAVPTFRFPDQDFLAHFFRGRFIPLGYQYNALKTLRACHRPMWRDEDVRIVHYIISPKPWQDRSYTGTPDEAVLHKWWWDAWDRMVPDYTGDKTFERVVLPLVSDGPAPAKGR